MSGDARARLSINRASIPQWTIPELVAACADRGLGGVGVWREDLETLGARRTRALVQDAGLTVTSLCRGGFMTASEPEAQRRRHDDNRRAIDEAAGLGTEVLVLVTGGLPPDDTDLDAARRRVADGVAALAPHAHDAGVRLAVEALHPMFCSDRSVINTLGQALDIAEADDSGTVAVVVDAYHVWWDPQVHTAIERAGERIAAFQVCDWVTPLPEGALTGRGVMGDGAIDLAELRAAVEKAGYHGPIEVEIFSDRWRGEPPADLLDLLVERYLTRVIDRTN